MHTRGQTSLYFHSDFFPSTLDELPVFIIKKLIKDEKVWYRTRMLREENGKKDKAEKNSSDAEQRNDKSERTETILHDE